MGNMDCRYDMALLGVGEDIPNQLGMTFGELVVDYSGATNA